MSTTVREALDAVHIVDVVHFSLDAASVEIDTRACEFMDMPKA
jgi:hypothetical protein